MFQDKYVFSQLIAFLSRTQFNNYVRKYDGNRYVKHFTCWRLNVKEGEVIITRTLTFNRIN